MKKKVIIVSGYFNPLHIGHIEYFHAAKEMGDLLFVIVNNDIQRALKGSKEFMNEKDRLLIISKLIDGLGDKIQSSSWLIKKYENKKYMLYWCWICWWTNNGSYCS